MVGERETHTQRERERERERETQEPLKQTKDIDRCCSEMHMNTNDINPDYKKSHKHKQPTHNHTHTTIHLAQIHHKHFTHPNIKAHAPCSGSWSGE